MKAAVAAAVALAVVIATARTAAADISGWEVAPTVGTDVPVDLDAGFAVEAPFRLRISSTVGVMPGPYASAVTGFLHDVGAINSATASLIADSLQTSAVWRTMVGYRPWQHHGFYFMAGYGLIAFGGSATAAQGLSAATGKMLPPSDAGANRAFSVDSTLQTADVEIGWSWNLPKQILLQAALGGLFTFAASSSVTPDYTPKDPAATRAFTAAAATYLDTTYTNYVFSPTIIVTVGYRL